jgi:ubiquinone/menaquinone biosynthesis C-methylase UbiE
VSDSTAFAPDLYRGSARYYDCFRVRYPAVMIDALLDATQPSGRGRLLDLACGTGQISFAVARRFGEVRAVDQEPDMIDLVREKARGAGADHVHGVVSRAEDLGAPAGGFELVTIGNAFHRLHREAVASSAVRWLEPNGHLALLWSTGPWAGDADWQTALSLLLERWRTKLRVQARVPTGWDQARDRLPDMAVLTAAGFVPVSSERFPTVHEWTVEALIGFVYSTSFLPRLVLGNQADAFERDLRREVGELGTDNVLRETIDFAFELARRPA